MPRSFAPSVVALALAIACSSSSGAPPQAAPCVVQLRSGSADLELVGSGSCTTTLRLGLRVATGTADAPTWTEASASPVRVGGNWAQRTSASFARSVSLTNTSAQPVSVVGLEWSTDSAGISLHVDRMLHDGYQS